MKGRTNQPLVIWVADQWQMHPLIDDLRRVGHHVRLMGDVNFAGLPDLILHPAAHQWSDDMWDYLPAALTAARKRKRGTNA